MVKLQKSKNIIYNVRTMVTFGAREKAAIGRGRSGVFKVQTRLFMM